MTELAPADGSGSMFDSIAGRYDLLNRLLSLGLDGRWRRRLVAALKLGDGPADAAVLDVATGTGDVALALLRAHPQLRVTGLDPSAAMLACARAKKRAPAPLADGRLTLVQGDAQALPFAAHAFAAACISFGIRNVPDRALGLREMLRVVRPGGRCVVLELGEPTGGWLGPLARWHVHTLVPLLGALFSGSRQYGYLQRSIAAFPAPEAFAAAMAAAGWRDVTVQRLSFGAVHLYVGVAP